MYFVPSTSVEKVEKNSCLKEQSVFVSASYSFYMSVYYFANRYNSRVMINANDWGTFSISYFFSSALKGC